MAPKTPQVPGQQGVHHLPAEVAMSIRKWRRYVRRRLRSKPQIIPHKIHYPGMEMRIVVNNNEVLYQADCEQMRLTAIYGSSDPIEGTWVSLVTPYMFFSRPIDVQIRPRPGVRTPHEEESNTWN